MANPLVIKHLFISRVEAVIFLHAIGYTATCIQTSIFIDSSSKIDLYPECGISKRLEENCQLAISQCFLSLHLFESSSHAIGVYFRLFDPKIFNFAVFLHESYQFIDRANNYQAKLLVR